MAIDTLDIYHLAIDKQSGVLDLYLTEAYLLAHGVTTQYHRHLIEIRLFPTP